MTDQETDPKDNVPKQPGPEEHPGEDGALVSADRTRLKAPLPDRKRADEQLPDEVADKLKGQT
jgi:hypothetical protein